MSMKVIEVPAKPKPIEPPVSLRGARELVANHAGEEPNAVFDAMVSAAADITAAAEKVQSSCTKILANQMATPIANQSAAKATAYKIFKGIAPKLDATRGKAEAEIRRLEASMQPPAPKQAMDAFYASEVRAALLRMPQAERAKAVSAAIASGDDAFAAPALLGNVALTGLGQAERNALLDSWQRKRHGATLSRVERLRKGLTSLIGCPVC